MKILGLFQLQSSLIKFLTKWQQLIYQQQNSLVWHWLVTGNQNLIIFNNYLAKTYPNYSPLNLSALDLLKIPNLLTLLRFTIVPIFLFLWLVRAPLWVFLTVYLTLLISDVFDGPIARHCHLQTDLGQFLDPLADKICHNSLILAGCYFQIFPWWLISFFILKDLTQLIFGLYLKISGKLKTMHSRWFGKLFAIAETIIFILAFSLYLRQSQKLPAIIFILLCLWQAINFIAYLGQKKKES